MKEIGELADTVKRKFELNYDADSVKYLEDFIERCKTEFPKNKWGGLISSLGAFLGQCIIENYGGQWEKDEDGQVCVSFDKDNKVYPFAKVSKQFEYGLGDSIYSFFTVIPLVFKIKQW